MADIGIHNVVNVEIDKYQLESGCYICRIHVDCISSISKIESTEVITLFSEDKLKF